MGYDLYPRLLNSDHCRHNGGSLAQEKSGVEVNFDPCEKGPSDAKIKWAKYVATDATYTWTLEDLEEAEEILMEAMKTSGKPEDYRMSLWGVGRKIDRMKNFQ